jgi:hypothetical protein
MQRLMATQMSMPDRSPILRSAAAPPQHGNGMVSLADALDRVLHCGVSVDGNLTIGLADVELIFLDLRLLLGSVDTIWPNGRQDQGPLMAPRERPSPEPTATGQTAFAFDQGDPPAVEAAAGDGREIPRGARGGDVVMREPAPKGRGRATNATADGLARLVLTLVKLLHEVLERQAVRRMTGGKLTALQVENVGAALFAQAQEIARLSRQFGFAEDELELRFGAPQ